MPRLLSDGNYEYIYGHGAVPIAQVDMNTGEVTYIHSDPVLKSVIATMDADGEVVDHYSYTVHGLTAPSITTDPGQERVRFGYSGEYKDDVSGLYYMRARWYDAFTATFLSVDPFASNTGDTYHHANLNPVAYSDPLGLFGWADIGNGFSKIINSPTTTKLLDNISLAASGVALAAALVPGPGTTVAGIAGGVALSTGVVSGVLKIYQGDTRGGVESFVLAAPGIGGALLKGTLKAANRAKKVAASGDTFIHTNLGAGADRVLKHKNKINGTRTHINAFDDGIINVASTFSVFCGNIR